jgi:predicted CoA-binding protein
MALDAVELLRARGTIVLVDWPSRDVPEALARAGFAVHVSGGPGPDDFSVWEVRDGSVTTRRSGVPPAHVDSLYVHRPPAEVPALIRYAADAGAHLLWYQSGLAPDGARDARGCWLPAEESARLRQLAEGAGLAYVDDRFIVDAVAGGGEGA